MPFRWLSEEEFRRLSSDEKFAYFSKLIEHLQAENKTAAANSGNKTSGSPRATGKAGLRGLDDADAE